MSDYRSFADTPRYRRASIDELVDVARATHGAQNLLEYQDRTLEMHDRIADAVGESAAGFWIGREVKSTRKIADVDEQNSLFRLLSQNTREVLIPVLEASRDVRWTVVSFQADGTVQAFDEADERSERGGVAQFRLPTPTYRRLWATAVGRGAMAEIRQEHRLSWAIFEQEIGPPPADTIDAAKRRMRGREGS